MVGPFSPITITNTYITQDSVLGLGVTWDGTFPLFIPFIGIINIPISDTDPQIDNFGPNEAIQFTFSGNGPWRSDSVTFSATTNFLDILLGTANESFALSVNGNPINVSAFNPFGANGFFTINLSSIPDTQRTGTQFVIFPAGTLDDFRIVSLQVTEVPEPATLGVLGIALTGLGVYRRLVRRRR
ncbi:MAG: PEP-CTERM sorting domain-containing protein [Gemmataceae bacterium]|nr:PEP-CTERM sorting domain-containing protein [Gemmataceae bacterium]